MDEHAQHDERARLLPRAVGAAAAVAAGLVLTAAISSFLFHSLVLAYCVSGAALVLVVTRMRLFDRGHRAASERHYHALFHQAPVGVAIVNAEGVLTDCNESYAEMLRERRENVLGLKLQDLRDKNVLPAVERALAGEPAVYEGPYTTVGHGLEKWISLRTSPLISPSGRREGCIAVVADMTESKHNEELIERLAFTDALTGLANRTLLRDRLRQAIAAAERSRTQVAVASVNLDRFKNVNDSFGIATGDRLLQDVAQRILAVIRKGDTLARSGGDQFILLLPDVKRAADAIAIADKIAESFREPWRINSHEFHATASVGVAIYPNDALDAETLIEQAQTAMERAKEDGGDCCHFYALSMNERAAERFAMETALRRALDDGRELLVHYQPQVELDTGVIVGIEALVRWHHPEYGLLPPLRFIPIAEETALIAKLDRYVLRQACRQARAWQELIGRPFRLAVNLSARQFVRHDLLQVVESALLESRLPAHLLELEITETVAMSGAEHTARILAQLQEMGVSIALDDFGTGFSSLAHLRQLPINRLKVDCSFVMNLEDDASAAAIVDAVLGMGQTLDIEVLAEGVETRAQADYLLRAGCRQAQGYLYARPLSPEDCERVLMTCDRLRAIG